MKNFRAIGPGISTLVKPKSCFLCEIGRIDQHRPRESRMASALPLDLHQVPELLLIRNG